MSTEYKLHENIASITADLVTDFRFETFRDNYAYPDILQMAIEAARELTKIELEDEELYVNIDWYSLTEKIADRLIEGESPIEAAHSAVEDERQKWAAAEVVG